MQRSVIERAVNVQDSVSASKHVKRAITEPTVNVSDSVTLLVTRFKQSPNVTIEEKLYDGIPSLQFSADHTNIVINNSSVKISLPESKTSQNISSTSIWERFQSIFQEVKEDSSIDNKDELLSLLEKILSLKQHPTKNVSIWTRLKYRISGKKWVFSTAAPYILKIIDIVTEALKKSGS